uniref:Adapter molecule Crk n=1 Tax=Cacopsylla melanoneura TaxID=428564 RepID=A0A8D8S323_9HEMI
MKMTSTFDPHDTNSWYFGPLLRQEAQDILQREREGGVFLVRDSTSIAGDFVLCVKEDNKVSHYIINKITNLDNQVEYKIGERTFTDLPSLLEFYKLHYLDTTPLIRPVIRPVEKVIGKYDFDGDNPEDLPFRRNEILIIINKDEENWWTAKNSVGKIGSIPVPYVQQFVEGMSPTSFQSSTSNQRPPIRDLSRGEAPSRNPVQPVQPVPLQLPALYRVIQARVPCAYDNTALKLEVGDIIKVTKANFSGKWEGELNGKTGHFPFTHVEPVESSANTNGNGASPT